MESVRFIVGVILPYVALVVFLFGMIWRIRMWKSLASPSMTLFPAPPDEAANTRNVIKEVVLFASLFKGDRLLWIIAWVFHGVLALIFIGHFRVFTNADAILSACGMSEDSIQAMSSGAGGAAGIVILIMVILFVVRRMTLQRAREVTGLADYGALLLIGLIVTTGNIMRFGGEHFDLTLTRDYFASLATFSNASAAEVLTNNTFLVHMLLGLLLLMLIPFSKILHLGGIFFTHQLIRKQ